MSTDPSEADLTLRELDRDAGVKLIELQTDNLLNLLDVNRVAAAIGEVIAKGNKRLVIDLTPVRYAGSAALGMLLQFHQDLLNAGGKLILTGTAKIDGLLKASRTRNVFTIAPDAKSAVGLF
jgi:anti-anti-sigma factor